MKPDMAENGFAGEHEAILDHETFDRVQETLKGNAIKRSQRRTESGALLTGYLYEDRGNRMSPTYATKKGVRYPFYVSTAVLKGRKKEAGSISRVSATDIEKAVVMMLRNHTGDADDLGDLPSRELIEHMVHRIVVRSTKVVIELKNTESHQNSGHLAPSLEIPWSKPDTSGSSEVIEPAEARVGGAALGQAKPELVQAVVRAHLWLKQLQDGTYGSIEELGRTAKIHPKNIRPGLRLAFLAPEIVKSIVLGNRQRTKDAKDLNQIAANPTWKIQALSI